MKVLITGAAGLVGHHAARRLARDHEVLPMSRTDLDITDRDVVRRCVLAVRPSLIINCAVLQVDDSEENPAKARAVNVDGPTYLAAAASEVGAEVIQFSTQYAFAGEPIGRAPYTIQDEPRPVNIYGATKVAGEQAVRLACPRSYILRTSWVYGSGKNNFLGNVHRHLRRGKRVRVIDDIWSCTTYVEDLIDRIVEILGTRCYGTFHVVNEGDCSYYDFAVEAGRLVGVSGDQLDTLIEIVHERDLNRSAARPRYTPMRCLLSEELGLPRMRHWQAALAAYVKV
jgi:dTDP-4-dehydrorhamnose reductase